MALLANCFPAGTYIDAAKGKTSGMPITVIPAPDTVYMPLAMHIGAPAEPLVKVGDTVKLGQKSLKPTALSAAASMPASAAKLRGLNGAISPAA